MRSFILLAVVYTVLVVLVFGKRGQPKCRFSHEELPTKIAKFQSNCLEKGFQDSTMDGCEATTKKNMKEKKRLPCVNLDKYLRKCGHYCAQAYTVTIATSDGADAGSNSHFYYKFIGTEGTTKEYLAEEKHDRQPGETNTWRFEVESSIGEFKCISIRMEGDDAWHFLEIDIAADSITIARFINHDGVIDSDKMVAVFCDPERYGDLLNLETARQSTTAHSGVAEHAIDGDTNAYFSNKTCTHTDHEIENESWWMVELADVSYIHTVIIFNGIDYPYRLDGAQVYTGDTLCGEIVVEHPVNLLSEVDCGGVRGTEIHVNVTGHPLTLCEVQVYGEPVEKVVCPDDEFACDTGVQCVGLEYVCDGEENCLIDGSDEKYCNGNWSSHADKYLASLLYFCPGAAARYDSLQEAQTECIKRSAENYSERPVEWERIYGLELAEISAGDFGVWGVTSDCEIYKQDPDGPKGWTRIEGNLTQISSGRSVWGVNRDQNIFKYDENNGFQRQTAEVSALVNIAVSNKDRVWGVNEQGHIHRLKEATVWEHILDTPSRNWKQVSVGEYGVWGLSNEGEIYYRTGTYGDVDTAGSEWQVVSGNLTWISSGIDIVVGVDSLGNIFYRKGISSENPTGTIWVQATGKLMQIDAYHGQLFGVDKDQNIFKSPVPNDCGGITFEPWTGNFTLRKEDCLKDSSTEEISWKLISTPCTAGNYMTDCGCQQCGENTFSGDGAEFCTDCPDGKISPAGSTSEDDCVDRPAPVPGHSYVLKNSGTGNYLVLLGDQEDIRNKRGEEGDYISPRVRNFTVIAGFRPDVSSGGDEDNLPTRDQGLFIFRNKSADNWFIEHANTGRFLLAGNTVDIRSKRCQEGSWLEASGTRAADDNYYSLALYKVRVGSNGLYLEHGRSGRYVIATGETAKPGPYTAVNADCNYYDRALWKFMEP